MNRADFQRDRFEEPDAILIAPLDAPPDPTGRELHEIDALTDWLEVRAGACGDLDRDWIWNHFGGECLYSLAGDQPDSERLDRLGWAAKCYDLVELLAPRDLTPEVLRAVPPDRRLISWRGVAGVAADLGRRFEALSHIEARVYRLVCAPGRASEAVAPLEFLAAQARDDIVAYAEGPCGVWSRLLAPYLGCRMIFAELTGSEAGPDVARLRRDYGLPRLRRPRALYGIVGDPVLQSKSPELQNAAFRAEDRAALYLPIHAPSFADFWTGVANAPLFAALGMPFEGFTVVSPHKDKVRDRVRACSDIARRSASCNALHRSGGTWRYSSTDPGSVVDRLGARGIAVTGRRVAVVGCGGAGRAIAAALDDAGGAVTLVNRSPERGRWAADILGLDWVPLSEFEPGSHDLVVHATPLGRAASDPMPFAPEKLPGGAVVVELVYGTAPTKLAVRAAALGHEVIDGHEILAHQVARQFEIMTGAPWPGTAVAGEARVLDAVS